MSSLRARLASACLGIAVCTGGHAAEHAAVQWAIDVRSAPQGIAAAQAPGHYAASVSAELAPHWRSFAVVAGHRAEDPSGAPEAAALHARVQTGLAWDLGKGHSLRLALQRGLTRNEPSRMLVLGWATSY